VPVFLAIQDVSRDGRMLLTTGEGRSEISFRPATGIAERDLAWFSMSAASQFSADGTAVLLNEFGEAGRGETYLRKTDGSPAVRVAEETVRTLSPDAAWIARVDGGKVLLLPTGAGELRTLSQPGFDYDSVSWFPDGRRLLVVGSQGGRGQRLFVQDASGGALTPLSTEGIRGECRISPDGSFVAAEQRDGFWIYPVDGRPRWRLSGVEAGETIASWSEDGRAVLTTVQGRTPFPVYRVDVQNGRRDLWKTVAPADPAGISNAQILLRPDGSSVMNVVRWNNNLFLVEGAR